MITLSFRRLSDFDRRGPGFVVEFRDRSVSHGRQHASSRRHSLIIHPPELGLLGTALFLGGLVASGTLRYILFGLVWLLVAIVFVEILPAILALMASGAAVVGLFGVNPEGFLAFIGLTLAGVAALVGVAAALVGCAALFEFLSRHRHRTPGFRRRGRTPAPRAPNPNHPAWVDRRLLSPLSQCLVSLAVRRLPVEMSDRERKRWEEEMRRDVEERFLFFRTIYALSICLRGAPAMPDGTEDAPQKKPSRG